MLGQSLLEYWLSHLSCSGFRDVIVLAHASAEDIAALAGNGSRWGLNLRVVAESRELSPAQALLRHAQFLDPVPGKNLITVLDHFPDLPEHVLFDSYRGCFEALIRWISQAVTPDRVGVREIQPGVWVGARARISPSARLHAPCWVGANAWVGLHCVVGPHTIIENGAVVESRAEIIRSSVGPYTYVGRLARVRDSFAWGDTLVDWQSGSVTRIPDPFLLCALRQPSRPVASGWLARLASLCSRHKLESWILCKHLLLGKEG
jgi:NDP-sugar pyrophosphorylase family protein